MQTIVITVTCADNVDAQAVFLAARDAVPPADLTDATYLSQDAEEE